MEHVHLRPPWVRGWLSGRHTVFCGVCYGCAELEGRTTREAREDARRRGWRYTRARGWLCPQCQR